jgi:voltage-gated potassium channel
MLSARGLVDLSGAVLIPVAWIVGVSVANAEMLGVLWVFKLARYSPGLAVLWRVIQLEAEPLIGVLFAFLVVLLCAAVLAYLLEGQAQPAVFGTVSKSLWWTIVTLTTTGYGDVTPVTVPGRMLAGLVMMCGILVFSLWAGILATGFSQEMRRRAFLKTWDLVARVPLFQNVGAAVIADVAQRLRACEVGSGSVVVRRGDIGDCMYFIVSGDIEIQAASDVIFRLKDGDFFGEMALITGTRRRATAVALKSSQLLILDIADFRDLAARHPDLAAAIRSEAERRMGKAHESYE